MEKQIRLHMVQYDRTGLMAAFSDDLKGLVIQGKTFQEMNTHAVQNIQKLIYTMTGREHCAKPVIHKDALVGDAYTYLVTCYNVAPADDS